MVPRRTVVRLRIKLINQNTLILVADGVLKNGVSIDSGLTDGEKGEVLFILLAMWKSRPTMASFGSGSRNL